MTIKQLVNDEMLKARKSRDKNYIANVTMILDRVSKKEKELYPSGVPEADVATLDTALVAVLQTYAKQIEEEKAAFAKVGNTDRVAFLNASTEILGRILPAQMSVDEVVAEIKEKLSQTLEALPYNKGSLMKVCMPHFKGRASNGAIAEAIGVVLAGDK